MTDASGKALDVPAILRDLPANPPQQTDFIDSVRTRRKFCLNEESSFRSATMLNLAVVAERLGRGFAFDPATLHAVHDDAADRFLYQPLRRPWEMGEG